MTETILTARLRMRPFRDEDVEAGFAVWSQPEVGRFTGGPHRTREQSRELIARSRAHQERHGFAMWAVEERDGGALIGVVGLQLLEHKGPEVEIGWALAASAWGRGYATEAARAWLDVAFGELELDEVIATILPVNAASARVAERIGMTRLPERRFVHDAEHDIWSISR